MLRAQQIIIDMPHKGQEPWITIILQDVTLDSSGAVTQTIDRVGMIHRPMSKVVAEVNAFTDPVLKGKTKKVSVAGIAEAIRVAVVRWIGEDYGSY